MKRTLPGNQMETYAYNIGGQLTNRTDFNGYTTTFQYDGMNRLVAKLPSSALNPPSAPVYYSYNVLGLRTNMTDASGSTAYVYDNRNRLAQKTKSWGVALSVSLNYSYDSMGNLTNIVSSDPNGVNVGYEYDILSRLSAVDDAKSGQTVYNYDEVGNLKNYTYPNLVHSEYQYDSLNRLTNLNSSQLLTPIANYAYTVGAAGNRLTASEQLFASSLNSQPKTINRIYSYDNIYRLTGESINGAPASGTAGYGYDPVGNRLSRNSTLPTLLSQSFTFDANDRLNTDQYDANGNTVVGRVSPSAPPVSDAYDFENHLIHRTNPGGSTVDIRYDGDGNRVSKTVTTATNSTTTYYVVDDLNPSGYAQVLEELSILNPQSSTVVVTAVYTYGHTLISQDRLDGAIWCTSFYGYDGHNNVRYLTDVNGTVTDTYDYDAFGNLTAASGATMNSYLFTGEQYDADLGLYYLRARYHNPDTGRFWTEDSYEGNGSDPASLHKYTYCGNNPVNAFDPSGKLSITEMTISTGLWAVARGMFGAIIGGMTGSLASGYDAILHGRVTNQEVAQAMTDGFQQGAKAGGLMGFLSAFGPVGRFGASGIGLVYSELGFVAAYQSYLSGNTEAGDFEATLGAAGAVLSVVGMTTAFTEAYTGSAAADSITSQVGERMGLKQVGPSDFISTRSGLRYGRDWDPKFGNRVNHVLNHTRDIPGRPEHGVFETTGASTFDLIDNVWMKIRLGGPDVRVIPQGNRTTYVVDMHQRVGYEGGVFGQVRGNPAANHVSLTVENGNNVITAYPTNPSLH